MGSKYNYKRIPCPHLQGLSETTSNTELGGLLGCSSSAIARYVNENSAPVAIELAAEYLSWQRSGAAPEDAPRKAYFVNPTAEQEKVVLPFFAALSVQVVEVNL